MGWTKAKAALVTGAVLLLAAGTATVAVREVQAHRTYPWEVQNFDTGIVNRVAPQVKIVPAKFPPAGMGEQDGKLLGMGQPLANIIPQAYGMDWARTVCKVQLPPGNFDYIANLPQGSAAALQREIERKFGLRTARETREADVLDLTVGQPDAAGLRSADPNRFGSAHGQGSSSSSSGPGRFVCRNHPLATLANFLERRFQLPVLDQTGLAKRYDIELKWAEQDEQHPSNEALRQALLEQLGLKLVPDRAAIEMLVVEKAR